jgi:CubicO group peptidase (beta-lactamase class C family)
MNRSPWVVALAAAMFASRACAGVPDAAQLDAEIARAMAATQAKGLALAVIDDGRVVYARSAGVRNQAGDPLETDTIMYGASLTKATFAWFVMQLVEEGKLDLDASIASYLAKPLPDYPDPNEDYANWPDLAGDDRWKRLTPRILLTHSSGFSNFGFLEPDGKLKFHFEPGSRYAYSGDGMILLQFVIEKGLGLDVGAEMQRRIFDRFDMPRTSMTWRDDFAGNLADGWRIDGTVEPHDERSRTRAAGSMDTTLADMSRFVAAYVRGDGLSKSSRAQLSKPQLKITAASQFPSLQPELPSDRQIAGLAAGLGVITFTGPQGPGFQKGGHNDSTGNTWVCVQRRKRCVLILSNDVRSEAAFPRLVKFAIGETGMPWEWEYGDMTFWEAR